MTRFIIYNAYESNYAKKKAAFQAGLPMLVML